MNLSQKKLIHKVTFSIAAGVSTLLINRFLMPQVDDALGIEWTDPVLVEKTETPS